MVHLYGGTYPNYPFSCNSVLLGRLIQDYDAMFFVILVRPQNQNIRTSYFGLGCPAAIFNFPVALRHPKIGHLKME